MASLGEPAGDSLLDRASTAYRRLRWALAWPWWRRALCRLGSVLRTAADIDADVEGLLDQARRRFRTEGSLPPLLRAWALEEQRGALWEMARAKLATDEAPSLGELLRALERSAWRSAAPRLARRGGWALAVAVLPATLPEVSRAARGSANLEACFLRPQQRGEFPLRAGEVKLVAESLLGTEEATQALWQRAATLETSGRLTRFLERMARKSPRRAGASGPAILVHAAFWCRTARGRLLEAAREALPDVELHPRELLSVVSWLLERKTTPELSLDAAGGLSESRAAWIEFAARWTDVARDPQAVDRWRQLQATGARLDRAGSAISCEACREPLRRFVRLRERGLASLPHEASVVGWVRTAWALSGAEPVGLARNAMPSIRDAS